MQVRGEHARGHPSSLARDDCEGGQYSRNGEWSGTRVKTEASRDQHPNPFVSWAFAAIRALLGRSGPPGVEGVVGNDTRVNSKRSRVRLLVFPRGLLPPSLFLHVSLPFKCAAVPNRIFSAVRPNLN